MKIIQYSVLKINFQVKISKILKNPQKLIKNLKNLKNHNKLNTFSSS